MKKILYVTGCLGFIGSYLTYELLSLGWYVKGVDKITYASDEKTLEDFKKYPNFSFVKSDINDLKFLYECDYVINTAAETHVGNSIVKSDDFIHSNINGVHHLLELIKSYRSETKQVPILLHFSTDEVYGDIVKGKHLETDMLKPSNPYSATKAAADMLILAWARTYNIPYIIVRPTNNYGIGQYVEKLIPKACKYLMLGRRIPLHDHGLPTRNWLHASDTVSAIVTIINSGVVNEIFNVGGNFEQPNIKTVEKVIDAFFNIDGKIVENIDEYLDFSVHRAGQDVRYALDDTKIRKLGWTPKAEFDDHIYNIVAYYKNKFIW